MMAEMGWSLAKAASWVLERRTGITISLDADDSVVMLMDVEGDSPAPMNAATEAIDDLLAKLLSGDIPASGQRCGTGELVDIPAREWLHLRISPDLDGDRLEMRDGRVGWENYVLAYHNVRVVPDDVRKVWPHLQRGQRPQLRIVGGAEPLAIVAKLDEAPRRVDPSSSAKRGARPQYDWTAFAAELAKLIEYEGSPSASTDPNWTQARIEEKMAEWCTASWGKEPSRSSVRDKVSKFLASL
jgi:hypothetical protein